MSNRFSVFALLGTLIVALIMVIPTQAQIETASGPIGQGCLMWSNGANLRSTPEIGDNKIGSYRGYFIPFRKTEDNDGFVWRQGKAFGENFGEIGWMREDAITEHADSNGGCNNLPETVEGSQILLASLPASRMVDMIFFERKIVICESLDSCEVTDQPEGWDFDEEMLADLVSEPPVEGCPVYIQLGNSPFWDRSYCDYWENNPARVTQYMWDHFDEYQVEYGVNFYYVSDDFEAHHSTWLVIDDHIYAGANHMFVSLFLQDYADEELEVAEDISKETLQEIFQGMYESFISPEATPEVTPEAAFEAAEDLQPIAYFVIYVTEEEVSEPFQVERCEANLTNTEPPEEWSIEFYRLMIDGMNCIAIVQ